MIKHPKKLLGATLLVAGTTIGAAMLAIPISTGRAGFFPSIAVMMGMWLYLLLAAFFLVEVNLAFPNRTNMITMAEATLGLFGKVIGWGAYLFLLYALNTAYLAGTASVLQDMLARVFGLQIARGLCIVPLLCVFGLLMRYGVVIVDYMNRSLMYVLFVLFTVLVFLALPYIDVEKLFIIRSEYVMASLSVMVTAFGFHVIIPTLVTYLDRDVPTIKRAIWLGSSVPLLGYLVWQCMTLGTIPIEGEPSLTWAYAHGKNGAQLIALIAENAAIAGVAETFALCAIITSFLGVSMSLLDCLSDGLQMKQRERKGWKLFLYTCVPSFYFSVMYPRIFFTALEVAGAFGVVILLALLPAAMCWQKRYRLHMQTSYVVPGGKGLILSFALVSCALIFIEAYFQWRPYGG